MAPELVRPKPAKYSAETDIYALGNIFETLLEPECNWDGQNIYERFVQRNWNPHYHAVRLHKIVCQMKHDKPRNRLSCAHWSARLVRSFQDGGLVLQNSPYF